MNLVLFLIFSIPLQRADTILARCIAKWEKVKDYQCLLESYIRKGERKEERTYEYYYLKPGWIKMKIIKGENKGASVLYNPFKKKVRAKKGGILGIIKLTFDPTDKKVVSIRGHRVDQSSFDYHLNRWRRYMQENWIVGVREDTLDGNPSWLLEARGVDSIEFHGTTREILWLDKESLFPLGFDQFDRDGILIHRVRIRNLEINTGLKEEDFKL